MILAFSKRFNGSGFILFVVTTNLVISLPVPPPPKRIMIDEQRAGNRATGFSGNRKILEIQLPLKIATKEDLVAWAKYVMSLMASKVNITLTNLKEATSEDSDKISVKNSFGEEIPFAEPMSTMRTSQSSKSTDPRSSYSPNQRQQQSSLFLPQYPNYGTSNVPNLMENGMVSPPSATYLPIPTRASESSRYRQENVITRYFYDGMERNFTRNPLTDSSRASQMMKRAMIDREKKAGGESLPIKANDSSLSRRNSSTSIGPVITVPFEAVITITKEQPTGGESIVLRDDIKDYVEVPTRHPPDEFPPYFETNFTLIDDSGRIKVVLDDSKVDIANTTPVKQKKKSSKKDLRRDSDRKRESSTISELLKMLGVLKKSSKNDSDISVTPPIFNVFKGTNPQKVQVSIDRKSALKTMQQENGRNETSQAQELGDEFDDNGNNNDDDYEEEEMGGSLQSLLDLLPLAVPILEDLSDPESDTDLNELLQAAIPLLEGLSEDDGENGGFDIPGVLVPILLNISGGKDGEGSDIGALLIPLVQLIAPLIGPLIGPLLGPLSRSISRPPGEEGGSSISTLIQGIAGPLSQPTEPGGMSPLSSLIAGVVSSLSKEITSGKGGSDLGALISNVVSGVLAGTSAGLSGGSKGSKGGGGGYPDSSYSPTSYGGYGPVKVPANSVNPLALIGSSIKDVIGAVVQIASSLVSAVTGILGASSKDTDSGYGPPATYGTPPASTNSPYVNSYTTATRLPLTQPSRQLRQQQRIN